AGGTVVAGQFVFGVGSATMTVTYTAVNDVQAEANETVSLTVIDGALYDVAGGEGSATGTILANDTAVTNTNASGEGSLRQAVANANLFPGPDEVTFEGATFLDSLPDLIALNGSPLVLTDKARTTIAGPGAK